MNNNTARRGGSPYEIVFGRRPYSLNLGIEDDPVATCINEEDLPFNIQRAIAMDSSLPGDKKFGSSHPYRSANQKKKRSSSTHPRITKTFLPNVV